MAKKVCQGQRCVGVVPYVYPDTVQDTVLMEFHFSDPADPEGAVYQVRRDPVCGYCFSWIWAMQFGGEEWDRGGFGTPVPLV